jgi:hypothetical protein
MLFSKASKKTRKTAEETAGVAPEIATPAENSKVRTTRSSKSKSTEASETGSEKHRKATTKARPSASEAVAESAPEPLKAMAAAANATQPAEVEVIATITTVQAEPLIVSEPVVAAAGTAKPLISREQVASLAYSYWVARGYAPGSPEQDWLRAERELFAKQ